MPIISDPLGLHPSHVRDMPIVGDAHAVPQLAGPDTLLALAGSRHSQGGHTLAAGARVLLTEPMSRMVQLHQNVDGQVSSVTVQAGMTWNALHAHLAPEGCAPLVQQSSPHFTIGGSISVNCHGRDPRQGPVATCIQEMAVYLPSSNQTVTVRPGDGLFKAVVGGYGSAGVIQTATLRVGPNRRLRQQCRKVPIASYATELLARQDAGSWPALHYGWLGFDPAHLFEEVLVVDCVAEPGQTQPVQQAADQMREDGWGSVELMRAVWEQHQNNSAGRAATWKFLCNWFVGQNLDNGGQGPVKTTTDWLRQPISFTAHRSESSADLLQEYFVPLDRLDAFTRDLAVLLRKHGVNVLSSTVRVVQADRAPGGTAPLTFLSYAPDNAMACVALDFECPLTRNANGDLAPKSAVGAWVQEAVSLALKHQGRYYLPYVGLATVAQFQQAYPQWQSQRAQRDSRLDNLFLQTYLP